MVLDVDLNVPPFVENVFLMDNHNGINFNLELGLPASNFEPIDDDVVICSPRSFAEARNKSRRNRGMIEVLDEGTDLQRGCPARQSSSGNHQKRQTPAKQRTTCSNICTSLEGSDKTKIVFDVAKPLVYPQLGHNPKAPTFNCPVCLGPFVEETSTKCGHIFCKKCIHSAIAAQSKCPTCRRKIKVKDTFRIYLPICD